MVAGIGFTMAIFIAGLAFSSDALLSTTKLAILIASVLSGVAAIGVGRVLLVVSAVPSLAATSSEAEASSDK